MSKYIKLEDIKYRDVLYTFATDEELLVATEEDIESLPTIEVSRDYISRVETLATLNAMMRVDNDNVNVYSKVFSQIKDAPTVVPSMPEGKWISTEKELPTLNDDGVSDMVLLCWSDGQRTVGAYQGNRTFVGQAWPVAKDVRVTVTAWMPLPEPYRPEPEDKQRGRLEKFNSVELKKILDNFCEQMACPLPEKTKNEIVAKVAGEHAKTVAAERLGQAMKESEERNG